MKKEIQEDKQRYGDDRRSPIVSRPEAKALREEEMIAVRTRHRRVIKTGMDPGGQRS